MARPRKRRKICSLPQNQIYGPLESLDSAEAVKMTLDEYETIRLIDLEDLTQEECSQQMNVARTTIQGIYNDARKKIADSLVNGKSLLIEGGDYRLCDGQGPYCGRGGCKRHRFGRDNRL
jgi:predicted DNA-binding protein (UPF0251 family)